MYAKLPKLRSSSGLTLLELVVTISLIMLTLGLIVVNYNNYNENQKVKQAALLLKTNLRFIQTSAFSANKPGNCNGFTGYQITFTPTDYSYTVICDSFVGLPPTPVNVSLPAGLSFTLPSSNPIQFLVLTRGVDIPTDVTITINGLVRNYRLQVTPSGDINDLGFFP